MQHRGEAVGKVCFKRRRGDERVRESKDYWSRKSMSRRMLGMCGHVAKAEAME
jgi:hypothetical protein